MIFFNLKQIDQVWIQIVVGPLLMMLKDPEEHSSKKQRQARYLANKALQADVKKDFV